METPGHTGTLGFGYGNNHHTYNRYNGGTGTRTEYTVILSCMLVVLVLHEDRAGAMQ